MEIEKRLREEGIILPEVSKPIAAYIPGKKSSNLVFTSGQLPLENGVVKYTGRVGQELSLEKGQAAARLAVINCLAIVKSIAGSWDAVEEIIKITGYIQCGPDFFQQAQVLNGASEFLQQVCGENGQHARSAVGVASLPLNAAVEIEMIARLK
ncbi:MAG TPA: RidA family protein [Syntrophomonadaceae bacterium]|nr:RidA family protein [Syntrophomonadaceae bacterium]